MDRIVFNQNELNDAIASSAKSVALCDNDYIIPPCADAVFTAIGTVTAVVKCSAVNAISMGMAFIGFTPGFDEAVDIEPAEQTIPTHMPSSFSSSFKSSFASSFRGSFTTSFNGIYEYEYRTSFRRGSFSGSFKGSSFKMSTSFKAGSMGMIIKIRRKPMVREIAVNGYGLNLI